MSAPLSLSIIFNNANWLLARLVLTFVRLFAAMPESHFYVSRFDQRPASIALTVLDEGTGGAIHLRDHHYNWLVDCGSERTYERTLKSYLHSRGVNRLDGIILTHGDAQHLGAAGDLIADFAPEECYVNPLDVRSKVLRRFRAGATHRPRSLVRGDQLVFGPEIAARVLYPPANLMIKAADDAPIIMKFQIADHASLLLESDAGSDAEAALISAGDDLRSDILIKGQHHNGGSGTAAFINAVKPELVIATARETPINEQLSETFAQLLSERGIKLFRQDQTGAVTLEFDRTSWKARGFINAENFAPAAR